MSQRIIAHLDMDAFFASVEEREKPFLKGKPLVIGSDPTGGKGRGVVSTASYAARKYGVHSALPISKAWEKCEEARKRGEPTCVFIAPGMGKYSAASREVFTLVQTYVPNIQQVSVDEAYLDLTFVGSFKKAKDLAEVIQKTIKRKTKLTCSIGIGPNKLIAKIASDIKKPYGLTVVTPGKVDRFLEPLPLRAIPGIGPKAYAQLGRRGVKTVGEAKKISWQELGKMFGKWGFGMYEKLRGIDERELEESVERKSIGKHYTFMEDTRDMEAVFTLLREQIREILQELEHKSFTSFRTVVLTVRFSDFTTKSRSLTLVAPLTTAKELELKAIKLALPFFDRKDNPKKEAIRLIGLRIEKLE